MSLSLLSGCFVFRSTQKVKQKKDDKEYIDRLIYIIHNKNKENISYNVFDEMMYKSLQELSKTVDLKSQKTFYILEGVDHLAYYIGRIWNDSFIFRFDRKGYDNINIYTSDTGLFYENEMNIIKMAKKWDTLQIINYSKNHSALDGIFYSLKRITNTPTKIKIETIELGNL